MKLETGQMLLTAGVAAKVKKDKEFMEFVNRSIERHKNGDWGDTCKEDAQLNEESLKGEGRLFSVYKQDNNTKIWIITEWDRSYTTVLFPDEY